MNAPRRWRPSLLYIIAAAFAIALLLVWQFFLSAPPVALPVDPPPVTSPAPGR